MINVTTLRSYRLASVLFSFGIFFLGFALVEAALRTFWPQKVSIVDANGLSLGLEDAELGHINRPGAHSVERGPEFSVTYQINHHGMRDRSLHAARKPSDVTRILLLGDSFTVGAGNCYERIWSVVFEQKVVEKGHKVDVIRAGVSGYDTRQEVLYLNRLLPQYDPDIVVVAFLPNDLFTNTPINGQPTSSAVRLPTVGRRWDSTVSNLHVIDLTKRLLMLNDWLYARLYLITARGQYFRLPPNDLLKGQIDVTKSLLAYALRVCQERRVQFVVLSIPQQFQVLVKGRLYRLDGIDVDLIDSVFGDFAAAMDFHWIPVLPGLVAHYRDHREDLYYRLDGHLNNLGNSVVADHFSSQFMKLLVQKQESPQ